MVSVGKLRNMTAIYLMHKGKILLLYRQGSRVANNMWVGSAGGHFEACELNDAKACVLRELEEVSELKMPFSAQFMMEHYLTIGRYNDMVYGGIADGSKVIFTEMSEF